MELKNRLFNTAFCISLCIHTLIFLPLTANPSKPNSEPKLQIKYYNLKPSSFHLKPEQTIKKEVKEIVHSKNSNRLLTDLNPAPKMAKKQVGLKVAKGKKNAPAKIAPQITTKNKLTEEDLSRNKSYLAYYNLINERIRQSVIFPANFTEGEVVLNFIVTADGNLQTVEIINENSTDNNTLRDTAVQIVKKASPFPPFPEELLRVQLTFNVIICFREKS